MFRFVILIINIIAIVLLPSCQSRTDKSEKSSDKSTIVETISLKSTYPQGILRLPGELYPYESVDIYAKISGFIENINVDRGSEVKQGDVLLNVIAPEHQKNWEEALAKYEIEKWHYAMLKKAAETPGTIAPLELETSQKALEAALRNMQSLQEIKDYLIIRAPFSGIITARYLHTGALVGAGGTPSATPIVKLEDMRRLRLVVYVPQAHIESIKEYMAVDFIDSAYPQKTFSAKVSRISHALDPKTRTEAIELDVDNPDLTLSPGRYVDVMWPLSRSNPTFIVPLSAVVTTTDRTFVIRIHEGITEWVDVKRGNQYGHSIEIFGPLKEEDVLVAKATDELRPGTKVEIDSSKKSNENDPSH